MPSAGASRPEARDGYVAVGYIRGPHGLDGEVKVDSLSDVPDRFVIGAQFQGGDRSLTIGSLRTHKGALLIGFKRYTRREQAEKLRGLLLEIPESDVPPLAADQYYRHQLVGLNVQDAEGAPLGMLTEVLDTGANDVYVVSDGESELLVPAIESVVRSVDVARGVMTIDPLPGLERRPLIRRD
jgi:16S rRNA processing protein RimM